MVGYNKFGKPFLKKPNEIRKVIESELGCLVSDRITVDGCKVGYMYKEKTSGKHPDSGWRFLAGDETEEYMMDSRNHNVFSLNTICNYDEDIIQFLNSKIGSIYIRNENGDLVFDSYFDIEVDKNN